MRPLTTLTASSVGLALVLSGASIATTVPAAAAPVLSHAAQLQQAVPSDVTDVRWRGRRWAGVGVGLAAGALLGAAIANRHHYYGRAYYGDAYYGGAYYGYAPSYYAPAYAETYAYAPPPVVYRSAPVYAQPTGPAIGYGRCWVTTDRDRGFGYWGRC